MFDALYDMLDRAAELSSRDVFIRIFNGSEVQNFIVRLNQDQLFKEGIDATGRPTGVYTEYTELLNEGENFTLNGETKQKIAGEPYLLLDTGEFYKSFEVQVYEEYFTMFASDKKQDGTELTRKFGQDILGLTNANKSELIKKILPLVIQETRRQLAG
jgi:hypothetical protein